MAANPVPVIVCDGCGAATPGVFGATLGRPPVTQEQRVADLVAAGWRLAPERDTCPTCTGRET